MSEGGRGRLAWLLAGWAALVGGTLLGWSGDGAGGHRHPPALVRAALVGACVVAALWCLVQAVRRLEAGRHVPADAMSGSDLAILVRGVRYVFLAVAALSAAAGWLIGHPLPIVVALVIAGVDILETTFLLIVVALRTRRLNGHRRDDDSRAARPVDRTLTGRDRRAHACSRPASAGSRTAAASVHRLDDRGGQWPQSAMGMDGARQGRRPGPRGVNAPLDRLFRLAIAIGFLATLLVLVGGIHGHAIPPAVDLVLDTIAAVVCHRLDHARVGPLPRATRGRRRLPRGRLHGAVGRLRHRGAHQPAARRQPRRPGRTRECPGAGVRGRPARGGDPVRDRRCLHPAADLRLEPGLDPGRTDPRACSLAALVGRALDPPPDALPDHHVRRTHRAAAHHALRRGDPPRDGRRVLRRGLREPQPVACRPLGDRRLDRRRSRLRRLRRAALGALPERPPGPGVDRGPAPPGVLRVPAGRARERVPRQPAGAADGEHRARASCATRRSSARRLEERTRLARELHDGLAQDLWLAKLRTGELLAHGGPVGRGPASRRGRRRGHRRRARRCPRGGGRPAQLGARRLGLLQPGSPDRRGSRRPVRPPRRVHVRGRPHDADRPADPGRGPADHPGGTGQRRPACRRHRGRRAPRDRRRPDHAPRRRQRARVRRGVGRAPRATAWRPCASGRRSSAAGSGSRPGPRRARWSS